MSLQGVKESIRQSFARQDTRIEVLRERLARYEQELVALQRVHALPCMQTTAELQSLLVIHYVSKQVRKLTAELRKELWCRKVKAFFLGWLIQ